ncbi:MAG: hypothetical protein QM706_20025 [Nitrospira sp.]
MAGRQNPAGRRRAGQARAGRRRGAGVRRRHRPAQAGPPERREAAAGRAATWAITRAVEQVAGVVLPDLTPAPGGRRGATVRDTPCRQCDRVESARWASSVPLRAGSGHRPARAGAAVPRVCMS